MRTMKVRTLDGRWRSWAPSWLASHQPSRLALPQRPTVSRSSGPAARTISREDLKKRIGTAVLVFRGYDLTNLGRGPELLAHRVYGPVVRAERESASALVG